MIRIDILVTLLAGQEEPTPSEQVLVVIPQLIAISLLFIVSI